MALSRERRVEPPVTVGERELYEYLTRDAPKSVHVCLLGVGHPACLRVTHGCTFGPFGPTAAAQNSELPVCKRIVYGYNQVVMLNLNNLIH